MKFVMEFAENLILKLMEDPKERDRKFREHVYSVKDKCQKTKEMWSLPLRPYGFGHLSVTILSSDGMPRSVKCQAEEIPMMISCKIALIPLSESEVLMMPIADSFSKKRWCGHRQEPSHLMLPL